jgi:hypothetical protein
VPDGAITNAPAIEQADRMTETKASIEGSEAGTAIGKRRSSRIYIAMPVLFRAQIGNVLLEETTKTLRVNAHGCLIHLTALVERGQEASVVNLATQEQVTCKVNFLDKKEGDQTEVGLEFTQPSPLFWHIHFPPEDWNPGDRKLPTAVAPITSAPPRRRFFNRK